MSDFKHVGPSVRELMHKRFCRVDGLTLVDQAIGLLKDQDAVALLIEKRDRDDEYGLVTLVDIANRVLAADRAPERVNLFEIMTKPVLCVRADMRALYCARMLRSFDLSLALVEEGDDIVGIIDQQALVLGWAR